MFVRRVGCLVALAAVGVVGAFSELAGAAPPPPPNALAGVSPDQWAARQGTELGLLVNRGSPGACESVRVTVDGKSRVVPSPTFPLRVRIAPSDGLYPTRSGKIDVVVEGLSAACSGRVRTAFMFDTTPRPAPKPVTPAPAPPNAPSTPGGGGGAAGGSIPTPPPKATGKLTSMLVPDGSFAEDDPQRLRVHGIGACRFDLTIARVDTGAPASQAWSVGPLVLEPGALLFNGTHFGTLAEGSYSAKAVGKDGCTGQAAIDFKVTPKNNTKVVRGQAKVTLDKQPLAGGVFRKTKDSNILFAVSLPQSVLDEPSAGCCELEYGYKNAFGAWETYSGSPMQDSSFGGAMKTGNAVVYKSVSGFREGTEWRVRVRAFKCKTSFEWSEWLAFKVDQT